MSKSLTYASYLRVNELLDLQTPKSTSPHGPEHDEMLFIVIHQVYELWFKEILHEIDYLITLLRANEPARATHVTRRVLAILKTVVAQLDVLETMTPLEFNSFRNFLESSSGFQSAQFREIEFVFGYKREAMFRHYIEDSIERRHLEERLKQPSLWMHSCTTSVSTAIQCQTRNFTVMSLSRLRLRPRSKVFLLMPIVRTLLSAISVKI